jgi:hypothetical protein
MRWLRLDPAGSDRPNLSRPSIPHKRCPITFAGARSANGGDGTAYRPPANIALIRY